MLPGAGDIDAMSDREFRHYVVDSLAAILRGQERLNTSLNGVEGDLRNRGLAGALSDLATEVAYERTQRKKDILPRLAAHNDRILAAEHDHKQDLATQTAWRQGLTFALGVVTALLGVAGFIIL